MEQSWRTSNPEIREKFWGHVQTSDDCWIWLGGHEREGYGHFTVGKGKNRVTIRAHRFAYELLIGPIPAGKELDHAECSNPRCVNPAHLEPITHKENVLRGQSPSAIHARKTHCMNGHEFTTETTHFRLRSNGKVQRVCRACYSIIWQRRVARRNETGAPVIQR